MSPARESAGAEGHARVTPAPRHGYHVAMRRLALWLLPLIPALVLTGCARADALCGSASDEGEISPSSASDEQESGPSGATREERAAAPPRIEDMLEIPVAAPSKQHDGTIKRKDIALGGSEPEKGAPAGQGPLTHRLLAVDRLSHDFGTRAQNQHLETTFVVRNRSDAKVTGIRVKPDCGCNVVKLESDSLEPGAETKLTVGFETAVLSGKMVKRVRIRTRDRLDGEIVIDLRIAIVGGAVLEPGGVSFRDVRHGTTPTANFRVRWYEGVGKPFKITKIEVPGHEGEFDVAVRRYAPKGQDPWRGFEVDVTFRQPPPLGMYSAELLVRTDHADYPRMSMPLSANVVGAVWLQMRTMHFGIVKSGTTKTARLKFRPYDEQVKFGEVRASCTDDRIRVTVQRDPLFQAERSWILSATVLEDAAPGRLDEAVIRLHTGTVGEETSEIRVRGRIRAARR